MNVLIKVKNKKSNKIMYIQGNPQDYKSIGCEDYDVEFTYEDVEAWNLVQSISHDLAHVKFIFEDVAKLKISIKVATILIAILLSQNFLIFLFLV